MVAGVKRGREMSLYLVHSTQKKIRALPTAVRHKTFDTSRES